MLAPNHELIDKLNPQQREAVITTDGPVLVIAGAGSGKTRVITHRIAWLLRECGVAPWQVFAATFTNKAAEEMRHRIGKLVPGADAARLAISTFHSLCVGILRREAQHVGLSTRFTICDDGDQLALIKDCMRNLNIAAGTIKPDQARNWIAAAKILMLGPEEARTQLPADFGTVNAEIYRLYQERLLANDAVDFDDLILHVVRLFKEQPEVLAHYHDKWRYILVDEYQDTNRVQFEFVQLLAGCHGNICAVGDEDQSIYSWRGADIENLLNFSKVFEGTRVIRLEQNYRSTETILKAASAVIRNNTQRLGKELWSERGLGEPITLITGFNERDEAAQVAQTIENLATFMRKPLREMAIFYRVNALSRVFEDQLRQRNIPYRVVGGIKFYDRAEVKDLLAYLRLVVNPHDGVALTRVINKPPRGLGEKSLAKIFNEAVSRNEPVWETLVRFVKDGGGGFSRKAMAGMEVFCAQVAGWQRYAENHAPHEVLQRVLEETGYEDALGDGRDLETLSRRENIGELISALEEFHEANPSATLDEFLERVALINASDDMKEGDAVSLMSLHTAKGLEYSAVFLIGMEEPIFPSQRAFSDTGTLEEERRLFYVGITRARDLLFLSRADSRNLYGRPSYNMPSLFLRELPQDLLRSLDEARRQWSQTSYERARTHDEHQRIAADSSPHALEGGHSSGGSVARALGFERRGGDDDVPTIERPGAGAAALAARAAAPAEEAGRFAVGARVVHPRLGAGVVVGTSGQADRRKVSIRFDAGLEMEVLEQFGGLEAEATGELPF